MVVAFTRGAHPETLALVTADGRLQLWGTATSAIQQQLARPTHLIVKLTCLAWPSGSSPKLLAVGCDTGLLLVWDVKSAVLVHEIHGHSQRVNHLLFDASGSTLFSCADDCQICCWDVASGKQLLSFKAGKLAVQRLALSNDDKFILVGSSSIRLVRRKGWKRVQHLPGHRQPVSSLCFSPDDTLAISSGTDRHLTLWRLCYSTESTVGDPCLAIISFEYPVHQLGFLKQASDASALRIFILSTNGTLQLHGVDATADKPKEEKPQQQLDQRNESNIFAQKPLLTVRVAPPGIEHRGIDPQQIFQAATCEDDGEIMVAHGSIYRPSFTIVSLKEPSTAGTISLPRVATSLLINEAACNLREKQISRKPKEAVQLLGAIDVPLKRQRWTPITAEPGSPSSQAVGLVTHAMATEHGPMPLPPSAAAPRKASAKAAAAANVVAISKCAQQPSFDQQIAALEPAADTKLTQLGVSKKLSTASQVAIVIQALQNGDQALLEQALQVQDAQVVTSTVARLPVISILPFLEAVLQRIQGKPSRVVTLASWLRALLSTHAAYLMSCPQLLPMLTPIYQLIDERLSVFKPLLKLVGRMQMLQSQIASQTAAGHMSGEVAAADPLVIYDEAAEDQRDEELEGEEEGGGEGGDDEDIGDDDGCYDDDLYGSDAEDVDL